MGDELGGGSQTEWGLVLKVRAEPDAKFENPLEFFCVVVPAVVIAQRVCRQIVVEGVGATSAVGENMVCLPVLTSDRTAADVAARVGFAKDLSSFGFGEELTLRASGFLGGDALATGRSQEFEVASKGRGVRECLVSGHAGRLVGPGLVVQGGKAEVKRLATSEQERCRR